MYGSSFRMETRRPRALSNRPMLAAVMPLPREEVTPPVTKTYFAMGRGPPGVFLMLSETPRKGNLRPRVREVAPRPGQPLRFLSPGADPARHQSPRPPCGWRRARRLRPTRRASPSGAHPAAAGVAAGVGVDAERAPSWNVRAPFTSGVWPKTTRWMPACSKPVKAPLRHGVSKKSPDPEVLLRRPAEVVEVRPRRQAAVHEQDVAPADGMNEAAEPGEESRGAHLQLAKRGPGIGGSSTAQPYASSVAPPPYASQTSTSSLAPIPSWYRRCSWLPRAKRARLPADAASSSRRRRSATTRGLSSPRSR